MATDYLPRGVIPANLLPMQADLSFDEPSYRQHLRDLAGVRGVTALTTNAHASEVASLSDDEQRRIVAVAVDEVGDRLPIIAGVYADGSLEAAEKGRGFARLGARALLVFPPVPFIAGVQHRAEMVYAHFSRIAEAADLPLVAFQYPLRSNLGYTTEMLVSLAERIPLVVAIKDWSQDIVVCERNLRALHALGRPFSVLTTYSQALLSTLVQGADGLLSGHGSMVAELHVELWEAVQRSDLAAARGVADRLFALTEVIYADPFLDMHNRMKATLEMLGKLPAAYVRPPLLPIAADERRVIRAALARAGLLEPARACAGVTRRPPRRPLRAEPGGRGTRSCAAPQRTLAPRRRTDRRRIQVEVMGVLAGLRALGVDAS
jgi:4-hydroxy-tetrahydrodipicolinate synthase